MANQESSRRWVATLIVLLLLAQGGAWVWRKVRPTPAREAAETALQRKIAASMAYDTALLRADSLLAAADTAAAARLLDSLRRQPTDSLFPIERQKLQRLQVRLDSVHAATARRWHAGQQTGTPSE